MRLDPDIYSAAAVDQWDRSQRRYARLGLVGLAWLLLAVVVGHLLHLVVIAIAIIVAGFAVIVVMSVGSFRETRRAYKRLQVEKRDWHVTRGRR